MHEEFELPKELSSVESRLKALKLPNSKLDRDELMFQAGWESALADRVTRPAGSVNAWIWKASTGVLAAALALMIALQFGQAEFLDGERLAAGGSAAEDAPQNRMEQTKASNDRPAMKELPSDSAPNENPTNSTEGTADLAADIQKQLDDCLTIRGWSTVMLADDPSLSTISLRSTNAKNHFELLREMVPETQRGTSATKDRSIFELLELLKSDDRSVL